MSTRSLAKKSLKSLLSTIIPNVLGLIAIPILMKNIGVDRFGIFTIALGILGYASILDFGMSRLLSKNSAEWVQHKNSNESKEQLSSIFSFSVTLVLVFSVFITALAALWFWFFGAPFLKVPLELLNEVRASLLWVILSAPLMALTGTLRGGLEGLDHFKEANQIQILGGSGNLVIPAFMSLFVKEMSFVFAVLFLFRILLLGFCLFAVLRHVSFSLSFSLKRNLLKDSLWMTLSSFLSPLLLYTDRLMLGGSYSLQQITFYGTPMDLVLRVLILPQALSRVMLPSFAGAKNQGNSETYLRWSYKVTGLICFPVYWILGSASYWVLKLWLGSEVANSSALFMTIFSFGLYWNSLNWVTFNYSQALNLFKEGVCLQLITTLIYILILPFIVSKGLVGVAWLWTSRLILDTLLFSYLCYRKGKVTQSLFVDQLKILTLVSLLWIPFIFMDIFGYIRFGYASLVLIMGALIVWFKVISSEEKLLIINKLNFLKQIKM